MHASASRDMQPSTSGPSLRPSSRETMVLVSSQTRRCARVPASRRTARPRPPMRRSSEMWPLHGHYIHVRAEAGDLGPNGRRTPAGRQRHPPAGPARGAADKHALRPSLALAIPYMHPRRSLQMSAAATKETIRPHRDTAATAGALGLGQLYDREVGDGRAIA
jgi:hypothetical protein